MTKINMPYPNIQHRSIFLLKQLGVAAFYALLIFLDHRYFESSTAISSFEASSGFALGVLLIGGKRYIWGVFLGAILINATTNSFGAAAAISSGGALEAFCGAWLLTRNNKFDLAIQSLRDYLRLTFLGGIVGIGAGANFGVVALLVSGFTTLENFPRELAHWWTGDMLGVILVTPLMLVFWQTKNEWPGTRRMAEAALLLGLAFLAGQVIFLDWFQGGGGMFEEVAQGYWMFLVVFWVAMRLGTRGTVIAINMAAIQGLLGAYQGAGFFAHDIAQTQLASYWSYTVILSVVSMALATYFTERKLNEDILRRSETKLRTLFESTTDAVMLVDEKGFLDCNKATLAMFGYATKEEFCSRHPADISPPQQPCGTDSMTLVMQNNATAIEKGRHQFEWVCQRADTGKTFPVEVLLNKMELDGRTVLQATVRDITERIHNEQELRTLSTAIEQSPITVVITDAGANIQYVNPCFTEITGYTSAEVLGKNPRILQSGKTAKKTYEELWEKIPGGKVWHGEFINKRKNGELYWEEAHIAPVTDLTGSITHYVCLKVDISERVKSRKTIERTNLLYKMLSEMNSSSIRIKERRHLFDAACQIAVESGLFHMAWVGLLDQESGDVYPVAQAGHAGDYLENTAINIYHKERGEGPGGRAIKSGRYITVDDIASDTCMQPWREHALRLGYRAIATFPLTERGKVIGIFNLYFHETGLLTDDVVQLLESMAADISFTLGFIAEIQERENVQHEIQEMSVFLQHARENERKHIARELHDELGQTITALRFDLNWMRENTDTQEVRVSDKLLSMSTLVNHTVNIIRRISEDLRPGMLDDLGLAAAIENHVAEFVERTGIACNISMNRPDFDLDDLVATALFRIIQESLTNVVRHAAASQVNIHLHKMEGRMLLVVQDNGCGFQPDKETGNKKTYGLMGMRERVKMLGGTLDILSEPWAGVRIEVNIPINK